MNATAEFDVFVSYNTLDHAAVEALARALKERGLRVFLDRWELVPGRSWPDALEGHLARCRSAVVVLGPSGLGRWQQRERYLALDRQARDPVFGVIPAILPNADPALGFLSLNTWVDLRGGVDNAEAIDLLAAAIRGEPPSALLERTRKAVAGVCPHRGLEVFREEDSPFFFGREAFVEGLRAADDAQSLVAVVGRSGSGKSSVARAGLVPALRQLDGRLVWEIATLLPGAAPLKALAGALVPLLEPEMSETDRLLCDSYISMGGVKGAIAKHAEALYDRLDPAQQGAAERAFIRLVRPGEESGDTRHRAALDELDPAAQALMRTLAGKDARLVVTGRDAVTGRETVEVAHEALIREWSRLKGWVDQVRERLRDQLLMDELAERWEKQGRSRVAGLASGRQLKRFERAGAASELAGAYLRASRARRTMGRVSGALFVALLTTVLAGVIWLDHEGLTPRHPIAAVLTNMGMWHPQKPQMILVSPEEGHPMCFEMGLDQYEQDFMIPMHLVRFIRPFFIGKHEVTFAEYDRFALATWRKLPDDQGWGREDRPVVNVTWEEAAAYADWLAKITGGHYRLPSEAEWEYTACAGTTTAYWWGEDIHQNGMVWANCDGCNSQWDNKQTAPVGSFPANPFGLHDTAGNVWEWVQDCWHTSHEGAPSDGSAWGHEGDSDCGCRINRGGSWYDKTKYLRSGSRYRDFAALRANFLGFRLAQDP